MSEGEPAQERPQTAQKKSRKERFKERYVTCCVPGTYAVLSCLTGQWMKPTLDDNGSFKCTGEACDIGLSIILSVLLAIVSVFPMIMFIYSWIHCPAGEYHGICYILQFYANPNNGTITEIPNIILKNTEQASRIDNDETKVLLQKYEDLSKTFLLFTTVGSFLSYILFVVALGCLYCRQCGISCDSSNDTCDACLYCLKKDNIQANDDDESNRDVKPFDPFNDKGDYEDFDHVDNINKLYGRKKTVFFEEVDKDTSTLLQGRRLCHFYSWFIVGVILYFILCGTFFGTYYKHKNCHKLQ